MDLFLNKFGLIRVGPEVLLAPHFLLGRGWTLYGAQGPLFDLGILPLQVYFILFDNDNGKNGNLKFERFYLKYLKMSVKLKDSY